jgi:hypothetical protein
MSYVPERRLDAALHGIAAVRQYLFERDHATWAVYAIRSVRRGEKWRLHVVTEQGESMVLTRGLALRLLDVETLLLSGVTEAWLRPLDVRVSQSNATPVDRLEVALMVRPPSSAVPGEAATLISAIVKAADGALVRLTIATPKPIPGWPR